MLDQFDLSMFKSGEGLDVAESVVALQIRIKGEGACGSRTDCGGGGGQCGTRTDCSGC